MNANTLLFPLARRFVAGIHEADALRALAELETHGLVATIDFLGEDVHTDAEADATRRAYFHLVDALRRAPRKTNLSLKLSAFGFGVDAERALARVRAVGDAARELADPFLRIDMERAEAVSPTLGAVARLAGEGYAVGPVLQAYLRRTPEDVRAAIDAKLRVRLCKGAYGEDASIAHVDPAIIRREFLRSAEALLEFGVYPGIATHDPGLIAAVRRFARERGIAAGSFEFQMLYGVRPALQRELVAAGHTVRVYVPYGTHWTGYFKRRILERKENALFALGALFTR